MYHASDNRVIQVRGPLASIRVTHTHGIVAYSIHELQCIGMGYTVTQCIGIFLNGSSIFSAKAMQALQHRVVPTQLTTQSK